MTVWALIPVKPPGCGKTRLAAALSLQQRDELVGMMLGRVIAATLPVADRTIVLGPAHSELPSFVDAGHGLNAALSDALASIAAREAPGRLLIVAGDLPGLTANEVRRLAMLPAGTIGIATDRHGIGTNALSLPLPAAAGFRFHYGADSAALHRKTARRIGLNAVTITSPGLAKDIDEPADLDDVEYPFAVAN